MAGKKKLAPNPLITHAHQAILTGRGFFPSLISTPFKSGLHEAFTFAIMACIIAAIASWSRGKKYVHQPEISLETEASIKNSSVGLQSPIEIQND